MRSGSRSTVLSVDLDVGAAPSTASWAERVAALCAAWYPLVHALLESPGYTPPSRIVLRMVPTIGDGRRSPGTPGVTSGTVITVGADWVRLHPEDTGLVLHELVHVVQSYPSGEPWWLTEGVADWVRYQRVETSDPRARPDVAGRSYNEGYGVTAAFLEWIQVTCSVPLVAVLNAAMRRGAWYPRLVDETVGIGLDELWRRFVAERGPALRTR